MKVFPSMLAVLLLSVAINPVFAQTKNTLKTETLKIYGNCEMCKTRIEKAAVNAGAVTADWNVESKMLTIAHRADVSIDKVEKSIALVGHDTPNYTAPNDVYNKLHGCCQYDRKAATNDAALAGFKADFQEAGCCGASCKNSSCEACSTVNKNCKANAAVCCS